MSRFNIAGPSPFDYVGDAAMSKYTQDLGYLLGEEVATAQGRRVSGGGRGGGMAGMEDGELAALAALAPSEEDLVPQVIDNPHVAQTVSDDPRDWGLKEEQRFRTKSGLGVSVSEEFRLPDQARELTQEEQIYQQAQQMQVARKQEQIHQEATRLKNKVAGEVWTKFVDQARDPKNPMDKEAWTQVVGQFQNAFGPGTAMPNPAELADAYAKEDDPVFKLQDTRSKLAGNKLYGPDYMDLLKLDRDGNLDWSDVNTRKEQELKDVQSKRMVAKDLYSAHMDTVDRLYPTKPPGADATPDEQKNYINNLRMQEIERRKAYTQYFGQFVGEEANTTPVIDPSLPPAQQGLRESVSAQAPAPPSPTGLPSINTQEEYDALAPGDTFVDVETGQTMQKPGGEEVFTYSDPTEVEALEPGTPFIWGPDGQQYIKD